jgi:prepilin-type N-terminal cleavage/methylation domain-containing protein
MLRGGSLRRRRGITLMELMVVVALMGLIAGISFPAVTSGIDTLRLRSAGETMVGLFNSALDRAERRQQPVEIVINRATNSIAVAGSGAGVERVVDLPQGVRILSILPAFGPEEAPTRSFLLLPGGAVPRISIQLINARGAVRAVTIDPVSGVARMEAPTPQAGF